LRYKTKVDVWLVVLLAGVVALPMAIGIVGYVRTGLSPATWVPLSIALLIAVVIWVVAVPTRYDLTPDSLMIRSGLLHWAVPLSEVTSITPTSNPLSSPAWSLERLKVTWTVTGNARSISISPERTEEFLREVATRNKTLVVANGALRRE